MFTKEDFIISFCNGALKMIDDSIRLKEAIGEVNNSLPELTVETLGKLAKKAGF